MQDKKGAEEVSLLDPGDSLIPWLGLSAAASLLYRGSHRLSKGRAYHKPRSGQVLFLFYLYPLTDSLNASFLVSARKLKPLAGTNSKEHRWDIHWGREPTGSTYGGGVAPPPQDIC